MKARISYFKIAVVKIGAEILSYIQKQNKTTKITRQYQNVS